MTVSDKVCATCGRRFSWRHKWRDGWDQVRYCSRACRGSRPGPLDRALETAVIELLTTRSSAASICPSEAARRVAPESWRPLLERTRRAARRLAAAGRIEIVQRGRPVDPSDFRGPIRLRLSRARTGQRPGHPGR